LRIRPAGSECVLVDFTASRLVFEPGWRRSGNVKPIAGSDSCLVLHTGYQVPSRLNARLGNDREKECGPDYAHVIRAGHDACATGDESIIRR